MRVFFVAISMAVGFLVQCDTSFALQVAKPKISFLRQNSGSAHAVSQLGSQSPQADLDMGDSDDPDDRDHREGDGMADMNLFAGEHFEVSGSAKAKINALRGETVDSPQLRSDVEISERVRSANPLVGNAYTPRSQTKGRVTSVTRGTFTTASVGAVDPDASGTMFITMQVDVRDPLEAGSEFSSFSVQAGEARLVVRKVRNNYQIDVSKPPLVKGGERINLKPMYKPIDKPLSIKVTASQQVDLNGESVFVRTGVTFETDIDYEGQDSTPTHDNRASATVEISGNDCSPVNNDPELDGEDEGLFEWILGSWAVCSVAPTSVENSFHHLLAEFRDGDEDACIGSSFSLYSVDEAGIRRQLGHPDFCESNVERAGYGRVSRGDVVYRLGRGAGILFDPCPLPISLDWQFSTPPAGTVFVELDYHGATNEFDDQFSSTVRYPWFDADQNGINDFYEVEQLPIELVAGNEASNQALADSYDIHVANGGGPFGESPVDPIGDSIGFSDRNDELVQAIETLGFITASYESGLLAGFTPSVTIVSESSGATVDIEVGNEGATFDSASGWATFDLSSYTFAPGYYSVEFDGAVSTQVYVVFPGDANLDGVVDAEDVAIVEENIGSQNSYWTIGDFDGDGAVSPEDLATVLGNLTPVVLLGDVNLDGAVNFLDISPFLAVISSGDFQEEADINQDGVVNFLDISPFIALL